ncbi:MAG: hypothetical protein JST40_14490 [Armatimonadetes bacterium]|nr:hypothetical protein [Armatimonadota bacterium]
MNRSRFFGIVVVALVGGVLLGCSSTSEPKGYTKADFSKQPAPPGYGPPGGGGKAPAPNPGPDAGK